MGKGKEVRATIKGKLRFDLEDKAFLLYAMNFKDAVEYAHSLMRKGIEESKIVNTHFENT